MSQRKKCSSKVPLAQQERPEKCLSKGIGVGMNMKVKVTMDMSKSLLRAIAAKVGVNRYSLLSKQELYDGIVAKGHEKYNLRELL